MSRICDFCAKTYQKGNLVPRGIGNRVTRRTITSKKVNLRSKRLKINGQTIRVTICASCLKRLNKDIKEANAMATAITENAATKNA